MRFGERTACLELKAEVDRTGHERMIAMAQERLKMILRTFSSGWLRGKATSRAATIMSETER